MSDILQQIVTMLALGGFAAICGFGAYIGFAVAKMLLGSRGGDNRE